MLVVTPDGRLSRYFYGVEYSPKELRLALVESGQGRIGSAIDELLLYCFHYDPESGRYGVVVMNLVRLGGVLTVLFMGGFILLMRRRESRPPAPRRWKSRMSRNVYVVKVSRSFPNRHPPSPPRWTTCISSSRR